MRFLKQKLPNKSQMKFKKNPQTAQSLDITRGRHRRLTTFKYSLINRKRLLNKPLKPIFLFKSLLSVIVTAVFAAQCFFLIGCGKRRPPLPPASRRPAYSSALAVYQQGNKIALIVPIVKNTGDFRPIKADVFRLAESVEAPQFLTEEEFASKSTLVGSVLIRTELPAGEAVFFDVLSASSQSRRLRYAVRFVNAEGQRSSFSNFVFFEPAFNIAESPTLNPVEVNQNAVNLSWQPPSKNIDTTKPANVVGYHVYRQKEAAEKASRINSSLLSNAFFADNNFKFGDKYEYFVRAVSVGANGAQVESADSNSVSVTPRDVFPPKPPAGLTIAAAPGNLSVFFAANAEPDVIGYNIFRTTESNLPAAQWLKLNDNPFNATSFQDTKVESGRTYFYYVVAVDSAGNISQPSELISETAP